MMDNISSKRAEQQVAVTIPEYDQIPVDKYQTRVIAFVDLLGFSQLIEDTENGKRTESNIYSAIQLMYDVLFDFEANSPGNTSLRISQFSDSVVMSVYFKELDGLILMIKHLRYIQQRLLEDYNILLRGGITCGDLIHTNTTLMGPAMIEAYHMECDKDKAIYPRIIVDDTVLQLWNKGLEVFNATDVPENLFMREDSDSYVYIDYLEDLDHELANDGQWFYDAIRKLIDKNIYSTKPSIVQKYKWLEGKLKSSNLYVRFGGVEDSLNK